MWIQVSRTCTEIALLDKCIFSQQYAGIRTLISRKHDPWSFSIATGCLHACFRTGSVLISLSAELVCRMTKGSNAGFYHLQLSPVVVYINTAESKDGSAWHTILFETRSGDDEKTNTVDSRYLDPSYLDPITYVELISKSRLFSLCIYCISASRMLNYFYVDTSAISSIIFSPWIYFSQFLLPRISNSDHDDRKKCKMRRRRSLS